MKYTGWILTLVLFVVVIINQVTIANWKEACGDLEKACAVYHRKLTGDPHPFYSE